MKIADWKGTFKRRPQFALAAAAILHLTLTLSVFAVGRSGVLPQQIDPDGIGDFASDGYVHKPVMDSLAGTLRQGELGAWIKSQETLHVKVFSISALVMEPLLGSNILTIEPVNLICYLAILVLTFTLARIVAGARAAWLATLIVALWPSFILHSTQFLRDPFLILAVLTLMTLLMLTLKKNINWRDAMVSVVLGAVAIYLAWQTRPEMWLVLTAIIFVSALLLMLKLAFTRKMPAANLLTAVCLAVLSIAMPRPAAGVVSQPLSNAAVTAETSSTDKPAVVRHPIWERIAIARLRFIVYGHGGSPIDENVLFNSSSDIVRYVPRALEIGYFAPFPSAWFTPGKQLGRIGRIVSGFEMALTYLFEALACFFVWRTRKRVSSWLLVLATSLGTLALGLVVVNLGTLYRMRYPFWVLIVIMAAAVLATKSLGWFTHERKAATVASIPSS
jgi:hypothetical protein